MTVLPLISRCVLIAGMGLTLSGLGASLAHATSIAPDTISSDSTIVEDPLHGFCWGTTTCGDNGTVTPFNTPNPQFGFTISPGPNTGYFYVDFLVPTNAVPDPTALKYVVTGTQGGTLNNISIGGATHLVSSTPWTSGFLTDYLDRTDDLANGAPKNPIGAFLPSTQGVDPGATGYYVYELKLSGDTTGSSKGKNTLADQGALGNSPSTQWGPLLQLSSSGGGSTTLELGSLIVGFLNTGTWHAPNWISTAQSGALFDAPEPGTLLLVAGGLILLGAARQRKASAR